MKTEVLSFDELESKIEALRSYMISTGSLKGLAHPDTIKLSQELDVILHILYEIKFKKSLSNKSI